MATSLTRSSRLDVFFLLGFVDSSWMAICSEANLLFRGIYRTDLTCWTSSFLVEPCENEMA